MMIISTEVDVPYQLNEFEIFKENNESIIWGNNLEAK